MNEWRILRGWSEEELEDRLRRLDGLGRNFAEPPEAMSPDTGWSRYASEAVLAREPAGPPRPDGPFRRARVGIESYAFSDPSIVTAHFDPSTPLPGRRMLLEIRVLGVHWLCGVAVGATRSEAGPERDVFGYRYETLEGHVERGHEWFLLTKSRRSGEIRYRIEALWKPGDLPNWWSRIGFRFTVPVYQRLWHHRAQRRLHHLALYGSLDPPEPSRGRLVHEGPPVAFSVTRGRGAGTELARTLMKRVANLITRIAATGGRGGSSRAHERQWGLRFTDPAGDEPVDGWRVLCTAAALGAVAGLRSMAAPALLSRRLATTGGPRTGRAPEHLLASPTAARVLTVLAAGELLADKLPFLPARTRPASLAGRALSGALCGTAVAARAERPGLPAALAGAGAAVASAFAGYWLRRTAGRRLHLPDAATAVAEDLVVVAAGARLAALAGGPDDR